MVVWSRSAWVGEDTVTGELKYFLCAKFYTCICGVAPSASPQREREREGGREREREREKERERERERENCSLQKTEVGSSSYPRVSNQSPVPSFDQSTHELVHREDRDATCNRVPATPAQRAENMSSPLSYPFSNTYRRVREEAAPLRVASRRMSVRRLARSGDGAPCPSSRAPYIAINVCCVCVYMFVCRVHIYVASTLDRKDKAL
jgi:hypothetical protein